VFQFENFIFRGHKEYKEAEKEKLVELFIGIAETECFMTVFKKFCGSYA